MEKSLVRLILLLSVFIGAVCGVLSVIPFIGQLAFWLLLFLPTFFIITFLYRKNLLELISVQQGITLGSIIGFVSFLAFSIVYTPIVIVLVKVFKYYSNYGVAMILKTGSFGIIILLAVFMAVLSAVLNAFFGMITYFATDFVKNIDKK